MLYGDQVGLRPVEEEDLSLLVEWRNDPSTRPLFYTPLLISISGQKAWYRLLLEDSTRILLTVVQRQDHVPVGMIGMANIDWRNQSFEAGPIIIAPSQRAGLLGGDAIQVQLRYAFQELNMHRAYTTILDFNQVMVRGVQAFGYKVEWVARKAAFVNGEFHDIVHMALLREEWEKSRWGKLAKRV